MDKENVFTDTLTSICDKNLSPTNYVAGSFSAWAPLHLKPDTRAGYGFHNQGSNGIYLYLDIDDTLKYMDTTGGTYQIQAVRIN